MSITAILQRPLRETVERELSPDERIVWMEMPASRSFVVRAIAVFALGIVWTSFFLFVLYATSGFRRPSLLDFPTLVSLPLLLIGCFMLLAPWWYYRMAQRTVYVITNKRAISFGYDGRAVVRSFLPEQLTETFRREREDGYGDVIITFTEWEDSDGDRHKVDVGLANIQNPRYVEELLKTLATEGRIA